MYSYEKRALRRFLLVYTITLICILVTILTLYAQIKTETIKDKTLNNLRSLAYRIASHAIEAQMLHKKFILPDIEYRLLDKNRQPIYQTFEENIPLDREFFIKDGTAYYIDRGAHGHLGIEYIVLKDPSYGKQIEYVYKKTFWLGMSLFLFLLIIGAILAREFLRPLKEQILKLDRFIKDTTHEINTPITTINLATKKIVEKGAKPIYLQSLHMAANLISRIYEDLSFITFNKIEQKNPEIIDLKEIIEESILFFTFLAQKKGVTFITKLHSCTIKADKLHIAILVKNLLDNAIKYAPAKSEIEVILQDHSLTITNEGSIKDPKRVMERFVREDQDHGGFGIGLDIVSTICRSYGYEIKAYSNNGKVTFLIDFLSSKTKI